MKLLFDQNLSPRLVAQLADVFADSLHVRQAGLDRANDDAMAIRSSQAIFFSPAE